MIDLNRIQAVALDIARAGETHERQDEVSEFIWHLLERHYPVFLFSSDADDNLDDEDFEHPAIVFLREAMPPSMAVLEAHPRLTAPETLWVSDDPLLQRWIRDQGMPFMYLQAGAKAPAGGQHLVHLSELGALLDPTRLLMRDVAVMLEDVRRFRPQGAIIVGIGGPPMSGFQQFTLDVRSYLQEVGHPLVELLDTASLMRSAEAMLDLGGTAEDPWVSPAVRRWLGESVLAPLRAGMNVYVEHRPEQLPADFGAHFPLYLSEASIVLVLGELVFQPDVLDALDVGILLELSVEETTRRLYEIPADEKFDPKFTDQYLTREGGIYDDYLRRNRVRERISVRIDANREGAFALLESVPDKLV